MPSSYLEARLLGGFAVTLGGTQLAPPQQPREQALLAFLMLHAETPQPRQRFAFTLWPDLPEARAYANLRYTLHHLRRTCPELEPYILSTQSTLHWQPAQTFWLDVAEFARLADRAGTTAEPGQERLLLAQAAELYGGELLPGCYDDWVVPQREQLAQRYVHVLQRLVDVLASQQELGPALEVATRLRHADPLREQTYQRLMELYAEAGDRAAALRVYHECVAILAAELTVEPSRATQRVYARLLEHDFLPSRPDSVAPTVDQYAPARELSPVANRLVGREPELSTLLRAWEQVCRGRSQLVLIRGEGGIGKTRLAEELSNRLGQQRQTTVRTRAYAAEGQLVYAPLITLLRAEPYPALLRRLDDVWQVELARLLPELRAERPGLPQAAPLTDHGRRQHLFEALARAVLSIGLPLLILIDDLQWADQETVEWLHYLLRFEAGAALLVVGTTRHEALVGTHPLNTLRLDMLRTGQYEEIDLKALDAAAGAQLAQQVAGRALDPATVSALLNYAQGVPLFLVEAVRAGVAPRNDEPWQRVVAQIEPSPDAAALPPRIHALLHARLTQLSDDARALVDFAAVLGRAFSMELLMQATGMSEEVLVRGLDELWRRRIVAVQGLDYDFSHDRIRDVAYAELSPIQRRVLHRKAAHALEQAHAHDLDAVCAQLAWHHHMAGQFRQAVDYYARAGAAAQRVYANARAIDLLHKGLALLAQIPGDADRDRQELAMQITLAAAVRTKGYVVREVTQALERAWELSRKLGDVRQHFWPLSGLFAYHFIKGEVARSQEVATELMAIADQAGDPELRLVAHSNAGAIWLHAGDQGTAQTYFARCTDLYTPKLHAELVMFIGLDYGVALPSWRGHHAWMIGQPEQALRFSQGAADVTRQLAHPLSQALVMVYRAMLHQFRREGAAAYAHAVQVRSLSAAHEMIYYHNWAEILVQMETARREPTPEAIAGLRTSIDRYQAIGAAMRLPYFLAGLAEVYTAAQDLDAALATLTVAQAVADQQGEHWWDAELLRLRAGLLDLQGASALQVDSLLKGALAVARRQQATSLALRAATSLARRWIHSGQTVAAANLLAPLYAQFDEGLETLDLQEAYALLGQIG